MEEEDMGMANTENILNLLYHYNPWWQTGVIKQDFVKPFKRFAYYECYDAFVRDDIRRTVILCGARRTGKTTIMYQSISKLLKCDIAPKNILFLSFEHPLLKMITINDIIDVYRNSISSDETFYCFFDEIQYASDWNTWLKMLYDNNSKIKIMATGSASPIISSKINESGLGRWMVIHIPTLSFYEYCNLLNIETPSLPKNIKPTKLHLLDHYAQHDIFNKLSMLQLHFIRYLQVGGFPELALSSDDYYAQRMLREDIVDKALKRDLPSIYGIRNTSDIEKLFLYLCYNSSNIINIQALSKEFDGVSRNTLEKYIGYLEGANLIYISPLINVDGKQLLKSQNKIYIADAAIRNAVLMKDDITNSPEDLGIIAETAVYKHIKAFYYDASTKIGYYRGGNKNNEIDVVVQSQKHLPIMIEVKYREQAKIRESDAIVTLANVTQPNLVITKNATDFGEIHYGDKVLYRIPAPAFLYLLGYVESSKFN